MSKSVKCDHHLVKHPGICCWRCIRRSKNSAEMKRDVRQAARRKLKVMFEREVKKVLSGED